MFRNFLKTAWRQLLGNKAFSFINIGGLAMSMTVCLVVIAIVRDAYSYDKFHLHSERIYRINTEALRKHGGSELFATSPYVAAAMLAKQFPGVEQWTMLNSGMKKDIILADNRYTMRFRYTDNSFFQLFNFPFAEGNAAQALADPFSIVLKKEVKQKLFGNTLALGKIIQIDGVGSFRVQGVLEDLPGKTHFDFEALASFSTIPRLEKDSIVQPTLNEWRNYYTNYTYIRLKPGVKPSQAENILAMLAEKNYKDLVLEARDAGYRFSLEPLGQITPGPMISNSMGAGLPQGAVRILIGIALVIILSATFNYTSLTIARAFSRTKEIAMRKITGSLRRHIFLQIAVEAIMTSLIALVIALGLLQIVTAELGRFGMEEITAIDFDMDPGLLGMYAGFAITLGLIAAIFPAAVLSRVQPLALLQRMQNIKIFRYIGLRKTMLVIQFFVSFVFISLVVVVHRQINYSVATNFGTLHNHIYNIPLYGVKYRTAVHAFSQVPGVQNISAVSILMGTYSDETADVRVDKGQEPITARQYYADENYIPNFELTLIAGANFISPESEQHERYAIVNEQFVRQFNLGTPAGAIGKTFYAGDSTQLIIKGVLKDFLFKPAEYAIEPLLLRFNTHQLGILNLRLAAYDQQQTISQLSAVWKSLDPYNNMDGKFYDQNIEESMTGLRNVVRVVSVLGILAAVIACLGLLGITIFTIQSKARELSIRKVIGATPAALMRLLTRSYVHVITLAIVLALPVIVIVTSAIFHESHHHIPFTGSLFVPGIAVVILLSLLTIVFQTIRAAFVNPVKGLREM